MASSRVGTSTRARGRRGAELGASAARRVTVGQAEGQRLAGAGAAAAEHVAAGEAVGDRGGLDRERLGDAVAGQSLDEPLRQTERGERVVGRDIDRAGAHRATGGLGPRVGGDPLGLGVDAARGVPGHVAAGRVRLVCGAIVVRRDGGARRRGRSPRAGRVARSANGRRPGWTRDGRGGRHASTRAPAPGSSSALDARCAQDGRSRSRGRDARSGPSGPSGPGGPSGRAGPSARGGRANGSDRAVGAHGTVRTGRSGRTGRSERSTRSGRPARPGGPSERGGRGDPDGRSGSTATPCGRPPSGRCSSEPSWARWRRQYGFWARVVQLFRCGTRVTRARHASSRLARATVQDVPQAPVAAPGGPRIRAGARSVRDRLRLGHHPHRWGGGARPCAQEAWFEPAFYQ